MWIIAIIFVIFVVLFFVGGGCFKIELKNNFKGGEIKIRLGKEKRINEVI